jgi:branched-subunit amino acid transport protein
MSANEAWMLAGMVAVTFGIRYLLFGLADRIRLAPWLSDSLKFIPPAVLTAITLPAVLLPKGDWHLSLANPYLVAALLSLAAGITTRNLLATIAIGLARSSPIAFSSRRGAAGAAGCVMPQRPAPAHSRLSNGFRPPACATCR